MPRKRRAGINEQVYRPADGKERDPEISAFKVLPAYYRTESALIEFRDFDTIGYSRCPIG